MNLHDHLLASLARVTPPELSAYLRSTGWKPDVKTGDGRAQQWLKTDGGREWDLLVPTTAQVRDYARRLVEVIRTLEQCEERLATSIVSDLHLVNTDVLRLRVAHRNDGEGSLPLEAGVGLWRFAHDLLLAGACATHERKSWYPTRKPEPALDYLRKARIGQTEVGSFVATIQSPVPPRLSAPEQQVLDGIPKLGQEPFERRVMYTLADATTTMRQAIQEAMTTSSIESFQRGIQKGITVNLCQSFVSLLDAFQDEVDLELRFSWARSRAAYEHYANLRGITFAKADSAVLQEADEQLRNTNPDEHYEATGPVIKLASEQPDQEGTVCMLAEVDGAAKRVSVVLEGDAYQQAVNAHGSGQHIRCYGTLRKKGRRYVIEAIKDFAVVSGETDDDDW